MLPLARIEPNAGQIPGLPANPRIIRDDRFAKLKKSIADFPAMLDLREIVVAAHGNIFVAIGGNMRLLACRELGVEKMPAKILPSNFPVDRMKEFVIKDNENFGEYDWDLLANEWGDLPLEEFGVDIPDVDGFKPNLEPESGARIVTAKDILRTKEELEEKHKDGDEYIQVICPGCAEEFFLRKE